MLMAQRAAESTRQIQETFESDFLKTGPLAYPNSDPYNVNGFAHKIVSAESGNKFALKHMIAMRLAFNKANVPDTGRIFICDSIVEATLNGLVTITSDVSQFAVDVLQNGMSRGMGLKMNLYGFDVIISNRLHVADANDGTTSISNGVWNVFMCVLDDQTKPIMGAWRRTPKTEGERNKDYARDEFVTRCRYGFGVQRMDTLGVLITSATDY